MGASLLLCQEEYVLVGREFSYGTENIVNYTVYPVTPSADEPSYQRRPVVHEISPKIFVASAQFERPFDYRCALVRHTHVRAYCDGRRQTNSDTNVYGDGE